MRVLVIGSDDDTVAWIEWTLLDEDAELCLTSSGEDGVRHAAWRPFDLVLLDPRLPDMSGPDLLKRLREIGVEAPVAIVSDEVGVADMSRGFGFGADAYITSPSEADRLVACIYRLTGQSKKPPFIVKAGAFTLEFNTRWLKIDGDRIVLCHQEFRIVELLARRRGEIFSKEALCRHLDQGRDVPEPGIVDVFVSHARRIMRCATGHDFIERVWAKGYRFREPPGDGSSSR